MYVYIANLLDTFKKINSLLVSRYSHCYQKTKGLKYPSKIDLDIPSYFSGMWDDIIHV